MFASVALGLAVLLAPAGGDSPTQEALKLYNSGDVDGAIRLLQERVKADAKDTSASYVLAQLLDFDGKPDEAVAIWEKILDGGKLDASIWMEIGLVRHRQGRDGPNIQRRRGMVGAMPGNDPAKEAAYKAEHLAMAATALEKARKLRPPNDPKTATELAGVYWDQERFDDAAKLWQSLVAAEPKNAGYHLELAQALHAAGRLDEAATHLECAIALNPRLAAAYEGLAEIRKARGRAAEAADVRKRAEFYGRLPAFCTLDYSEANAKTLAGLGKEETVRRLADDRSETAAQFLAVLCWSHPHEQLETRAFESLESRGPATTPLLQGMLAGARSTCTIRQAAHILARRKADGLFNFLAERLPSDVRGFGMEMDLAGALDDLGDPRAVGPLVELLNPPGGRAADELLTDRTAARARAALALGAFDTKESRAALDAARREPKLRPYCLAALYRLTNDAKLLAEWDAAAEPVDGVASYLMADYFARKVGTPEAKRLASTWQKRREAAEEAQKKPDADKKGNPGP